MRAQTLARYTRIAWANGNHRSYFVWSMCFLIVAVASRDKGVALVLVGQHVSNLIVAIYVVYFRRRTSVLWSVDCVWFNLTMAIVSAAIFKLWSAK